MYSTMHGSENVISMVEFHILLTMYPGMILVKSNLTHNFSYVYFYSLHVSGSHVPIIRRIIVSMRHLVYAILCG